jgi:tight adherence protein B
MKPAIRSEMTTVLSNDLIMLVAAALGATAISSVIFVVLYPYVSGERKTDKRVRSVTESRAHKVATRAAAETAASRRQTVSATLKDLEQRQKAKEKLTLRLRLQRAGLQITPKTFWILSVLCGLTLGLVIYLSLPPSILRLIVAVLLAFVGVFGLPRWILAKLISRRQSKFLSELPNAIDVVVRGMKAGLPLGECLQVISRESPAPLNGEFKEVVDQQRVGVTLSEALERLAMRMPIAEVRFLTIVIAIQQQAGGNLSEALGNLASVLRDRFRLRMKVKALSAEAKASAFVLASLPPIVMVMVYGSSPDYIEPLFNTRTGYFMLGFSAVWMLMGVLVMRKMINFKF